MGLVAKIFFLSFLSIFLLVQGRVIYKLDPTWPNDSTVFQNPIFSAAVNPTDGHVFVSQRSANTSYIYEFDSYGNYLSSIIQNRTVLDQIHGMRIHSDLHSGMETIWVTDVGNGPAGHTVKQFTLKGDLSAILGTPGRSGTNLKPVQFDNVADIAFDDQSFMYVVDGDGGLNNRLLKIDMLSKAFDVVWSVGQNGTKPGQLYVPHSVAVSPTTGLVWVADRMNDRLQVFHPFNGSVISSCTMEGGQPYSVRFSGDNSHIIVAQLQNNSIALISAETPSGFSSYCKTVDSIQLARDISPHLVAVDKHSGAVYVAEIGAQACQKFVPIKQHSGTQTKVMHQGTVKRRKRQHVHPRLAEM